MMKIASRKKTEDIRNNSKCKLQTMAFFNRFALLIKQSKILKIPFYVNG